MLNEIDEHDSPETATASLSPLQPGSRRRCHSHKEVIDRVEGKVPQPIAGDPENPLVIERVIHEIVKPEEKLVSYSQAS